MNIISVQGDDDLVSEVNTWVMLSLAKNPNLTTLHLPAGKTPQTLYRSWETERPQFLNGLQFQQVDDVLTGPKSGCFKLFFSQYLPSYQNQFIPLSSSPISPGNAILGVGPNGHLAFHEPEINLSLNYGCVRLSPSTCESLDTTEPTWGITYGAAYFSLCPALIIIAKGSNKKPILQKSLSENSPTSPFSYILKTHPNCTLIVDQNSL